MFKHCTLKSIEQVREIKEDNQMERGPKFMDWKPPFC